MQCLNRNNKEIRAALDEVTKVLGNEDAAYYVISENNGYAIDQAPNGAQSKLFSDLLDYYNGNREQAIKSKAKLFSDSFKNWFGNWINEISSLEINDFVSEQTWNGYSEILTRKVYIGDKQYGISLKKEEKQNRVYYRIDFGVLQDGHINTFITNLSKDDLHDLRSELTNTLAFARKRYKDAKFYFQASYNAYTNDEEKIKDIDKITEDTFDELRYIELPYGYLAYTDTNDDEKIRYNYVDENGEEQYEWLTTSDAVDLIKQFRDSTEVDMLLNYLSGIEDKKQKQRSLLYKRVLSQLGYTNFIYDSDTMSWYADYNGASKVVDENGEPLIVYHNGYEDIKIFNVDEYGDIYFGDYMTAATYSGLPTKVFLSIRNPLTIDGKGEEIGDAVEKQYPGQRRLSANADYDGVIYSHVKDVGEGIMNFDISSIEMFWNDYEKQNYGTVYSISNPNLVKSIDNSGAFSTQDNNIHRNEVSTSTTFFSSIDSVTGTWLDGSPRMSTTSGQVVERLKQYILKDSIIYQMLDLFSDTDVYIGITEEKDQLANGAYMWYSDITHTIWINKELFEQTHMEYNAKSIVHEIVHAFTSRSFENVKNGIGTDLEIKVYNKIKDLLEFNRKLYQEIHDKKGEWTGELYGLKDEHEFISEFFTNEEFVNNIIDDARQKGLFEEVISKIREVWSTIINLLTGRGYVKNTENTRSLLMELLSFNLEDNNEYANIRYEKSLNNNLKQLENNLHEAERYNFNTKEELDNRLKDIRKSLEEGLQSRLNAIDEKDPASRRELREQIKYQIKNLQNDILSDIKVISDFTDELKDDIRTIAKEVIDAYSGRTDALTNERLVSLNKNYFGFYCKYANEVYNSLINLSEYRNIIGDKQYDKLVKELEICKQILDACSDHVKRMQVENARRIMLDNGIRANSPTIYNYLVENTKETNHDISYITRLLGAGDKINDEAIKSLYNILQNTEDTIRRNTFNKAQDLLKLLKEAKNNQKVLFEVDNNGQTTGYIVRDRNYGAFQNDYKNYLKQLRMELGINPNDITLPENKEIRIEYNRRKNEWLSNHCERKYTKEYYELFYQLSDEAANARELIVIKIRDLSDKYRDIDGIVHYEKFSDEEWSTLQQLFLEKKQLSSKYDIYGNEKSEGSVERAIADELTELNDKLAKGLKMKTNREKFEQVRKNKEETLTAKEYKKWLDRNTRTVYSEEFYELLSKIDRTNYGPKYEELNRQKREILNTFRDDKTGEINVNLMPNSTINLLNRIDIQLRNLRKAKKASKSKEGLKFDDIAKVVPTQQYKEDYNKAVLADQENPGTLQIFELQHTYIDAQGRTVPKSYYTRIVPKDTKYISIEPSMNFSELSEESPFYNKNFDRQNEEYYQPKKSLYDNSKAYNAIMNNPALKALRQSLIDTMEESNSKLDNLHGLNKYKLPQISGSMYKFLKAHNYNPFTGISNYLLDAISVKGDDVGIQKKVKTAPDGTSLAMVPQYFIKDLDNPATISADMVGSVIQYFKMAENYKQKSAIKAEVENIKAFLAQRSFTGTTDGIVGKVKSLFKQKIEPKEGKETNIYKFAEKFINMNVYDVKLNAITVSIGKREYNITKILNALRVFGTLRNLGLNYACAFTGFFTALHSHLVNILTGRYYDFNDAAHGFADMVYDLFRYGINAGNRNYKSQQMALMDYFEVGSSTESLYKNTNRYRFINVVSDNWAFHAYSASDYLIKGQILNSVMYNYRNVNGTFMSKEQYFNKFGRNSDTKSAWKKYKTFKGSINFVGGRILAKDTKDQKAVRDIEQTIGNTAKNLAASADGMLTPLQKAQFTTNVFGAMCMMHRQYIPIIMQERWIAEKQWDYTSQRYVEGLLRTPLRVFSQIYRDRKNVNVASELFNKFVLNRGFEDELTRTNMKKLKIEIPLILAIWPFISYTVGQAADKDKRNKLLNLFAYIMARTSFEVGAPYNAVDIYSTIKTPTPLYSLIDNFGIIASYPIEQIQNLFTGKSTVNKKITRGAYKGNTRLEKALWQSTPFKNVKELNDIPSKRRYYEKQIAGN